MKDVYIIVYVHKDRKLLSNIGIDRCFESMHDAEHYKSILEGHDGERYDFYVYSRTIVSEESYVTEKKIRDEILNDARLRASALAKLTDDEKKVLGL